MMKKTIIAALVGGIILFIWQFLSWGLINIHRSQMDYTSHQDEILEFLNNSGLEEGDYFLPTVPKGATPDEMAALQETAAGKPWARIQYRSSFSSSMGLNMVRGFVLDFIAAWLLVWILMKIPNITMSTALICCVAIGLIGYFTISYLNSTWFEGNSIPDLIDAIVGWGLVGLWLGWYLKR